jgi:hypothetical protein
MILVSFFLLGVILLGIVYGQSVTVIENESNPNPFDDMYNNNLKPNLNVFCNSLDKYIQQLTPDKVTEINNALTNVLELLGNSNIYNSINIDNQEFICIVQSFKKINYKNTSLLTKIIDKLIKLLTDVKGKL